MAINNNKIIIVGAGPAGLFTAIKLAPLKVILITSKILAQVLRQWAQAGIAAAVGKFDSVSSHLNDTVQVGGIVDQKIAELVIKRPDRK